MNYASGTAVLDNWGTIQRKKDFYKYVGERCAFDLTFATREFVMQEAWEFLSKFPPAVWNRVMAEWPEEIKELVVLTCPWIFGPRIT
jgi:hypothetical protein